MPDERVVELEAGCRPEAAVSGGLLVQSEDSAFFLFNAMSNGANQDGVHVPLGTAVMEFEGICTTLFGSPNDEGRPEHPLYRKGLGELGYAVCEVLNSQWARREAERGEATARRIWGSGYERAYRGHDWTLRHFLVTCHESTFECLAKRFTVTISQEPYGVIIRRVTERLAGNG